LAITGADQESWSWDRLSQQSRELSERLAPLAGLRVGMFVPPTGFALACLAALDKLGSEVVLLPAWVTEAPPTVAARLDALLRPDASPRAELLEPLEPEPPLAGGITILTSGTTGEPKSVRHTWSTLLRAVRSSAERGEPARRWLLAYPPHLYAGLQVVVQSVSDRGTLIVPARDASPEQLLACLAEHQVTHASGTPSFWRRLVLGCSPKQWSSAA